MMSPMVVVEDVHKSFGKTRALRGVDLEIEAGQVFGLLGPNGAGKTTLVRVLTTLLRPEAGRASVAGYDVAREPQGVRRSIGLAGQYAAVDETLTGRENLEMVGRLYRLGGREAKERAANVLERFDLVRAADRPVKGYSGGMRRRLDLGASLVGRPRVLFLDEPTTGLDPQSRLGMWETIEELVGDGTTLLLTTQYLEEADRLADRIAVIDEGAVIAEGTANELKSGLDGDVVVLTIEDPTRLDVAVEALRLVGTGEPRLDRAASTMSIPVAEGARSLMEAVRRLDAAGIEPADLGLRRPSLDEVFLDLTGRHAARDGEPEARVALAASGPSERSK
jgi:ABC-2 type transport system ATP-binding protein